MGGKAVVNEYGNVGVPNYVPHLTLEGLIDRGEAAGGGGGRRVLRLERGAGSLEHFHPGGQHLLFGCHGGHDVIQRAKLFERQS